MERQVKERGEWYHCFNASQDRSRLFASNVDYERFVLLMYLANGARNLRPSNVRNASVEHVLTNTRLNRGKNIVEIGAYSLSPTHIHIIVQESSKAGIAEFMRKIFTGYTMYFNNRFDRRGHLFAGTYRSRHLDTNRAFKRAINFVHLDAANIFRSNTDVAKRTPEEIVRAYRYSSFRDHDRAGEARPERKLLSNEVFSLFSMPESFSSMLFDARAYRDEAGTFLPQDTD